MPAPDLTQIKPEDRLAFLRSVAEPMSKALEKMFAEAGRPYEAPILEINNNGDSGGIYASNRKLSFSVPDFSSRGRTSQLATIFWTMSTPLRMNLGITPRTSWVSTGPLSTPGTRR
jgi:hypothetical protein